jgi:hypothetical protein
VSAGVLNLKSAVEMAAKNTKRLSFSKTEAAKLFTRQVKGSSEVPPIGVFVFALFSGHSNCGI